VSPGFSLWLIGYRHRHVDPPAGGSQSPRLDTTVKLFGMSVAEIPLEGNM